MKASDCEHRPQLSIFPTDFGWFGLLGAGQTVWYLKIGHTSAEQVRQSVRILLKEWGQTQKCPEADWFPELRRRLEQYAQGHRVEFLDIEVRPPSQTPFQRQVVTTTRQLAYGQTITYGELAGRAGAPRAARAVGSVMAANRFPIIIPCHRVVAASGKLGGFSAPQGVDLKQRMLALEAEAAQQCQPNGSEKMGIGKPEIFKRFGISPDGQTRI